MLLASTDPWEVWATSHVVLKPSRPESPGDAAAGGTEPYSAVRQFFIADLDPRSISSLVPELPFSVRRPQASPVPSQSLYFPTVKLEECC